MQDVRSGGRVFEFVGGALCLDFANTVGGLRGASATEHEYLRDYADVAAWGRQAGITAATAATAASDPRPVEAEAVFQRAIALREAIYRLGMAVLGDGAAAPGDIAILNAEARRAAAHRHIRWMAHGGVWAWDDDGEALDAPLWRVAHDAARLFTSAEVGMLQQCASATCGWLFLDTSKNHSRRWCDMGGCGNREKARRHRGREQA